MHPSRMFELGPGRKFRITADTGHWNGVTLESRLPDRWEKVVSADLLESLLKALARVAMGAIPDGFKWTTDDRYTNVDSRTDRFTR